MNFYPINLKIENEKCFVIGGGKVAYRKILGLLEAGAKVEVISPEVCKEVEELFKSGKINLLREKYSPEKISDGLILIAATSDEKINQLAVEDAKKKNILVNSANGGGNFNVPSKIQRDDFLLTISTGGNSPAFSKFVREILEKEFDENFAEGLKIISKRRDEIKKFLPDVEARKNFWREILTPEVWENLKRGELDKL